VLRKVIFDEGHADDPVVQRERENYESGRLVSTDFFADLVHAKFRELEDGGVDAVLGGWPRSVEQAEGLMPKLVAAYGKENVHAFLIDIPEEVYRDRSAKRLWASPASDGTG
jgi:adenylate kinase family enzyme